MKLLLASVLALLLAFNFVSAQDGCEVVGLRETYYSDRSFSPPALYVATGKPFQDWGLKAPYPGVPTNFAVRWDGRITFPVAGTYLFQARHDDGFRIYLDGSASPYCEWYQVTAPRTTTCKPLVIGTAGSTHSIVINYYDNENGALLQLFWMPPGATGYSEIPLEVFSYTNCTITNPVIAKVSDISPKGEGKVQISLSAMPTSNVTIELSSDCYFFSECLLEIQPGQWNASIEVTVYENPASTDRCCPIIAQGVDGDSDYYLKTASVSLCKSTTTAQAYSYGDPHMKTFDGQKYDFFDIGDFYFLRDLTGELVVQTRQDVCAQASCNYAVAVKYRTVVFYVFITPQGAPSQELVGDADLEGVTITLVGNLFTFFTPSGAKITIKLDHWEARNIYYLTVNAFLPSTFFNKVNGQAGFYDGHKENDFTFDGQTYATGQEFARIWEVGTSDNLFLNPFAPILPLPNAPVAGAITYASCVPPPPPPGTITRLLIKNETESPLKNETTPSNPSYFPIEDCRKFTDLDKKQAALKACSAFEGPLATCCANLGVNPAEFFDNCICDYNVADGPDFVYASVDAFYQECEAAARLQSTSCKLCPSDCNGKGTCKEGSCNCKPGIRGEDCSEDWNTPPVVFTPPEIPKDCAPSTLSVSGQNFFGDNLVCLFGTLAPVAATKVSNFLVICPIPKGLKDTVVELSIRREDDRASKAVLLTRFVSCCSNPCLNGGKCVGADDSRNYTCTCPPGLFPPLCEPCALQTPSVVSAPAGAGGDITVRLSHQPSSDVRVSLGTNCAYLSECELTFTPLNWNIVQTVTASQITSSPVATCAVTATTEASNACGNLTTTTLVSFVTLRSARGISYGDPHMVTYDQLRYDNFLVGDFVVTRDVMGEFVVQARQDVCAQASCNYGIAIKFRSTVYYIFIDQAGNPQINLLGGNDGVIITYEAPDYCFYTPTGIKASVRIGYWAERRVHYLDLYTYVGSAYAGLMAGLLGNYNGNPSDEFIQSNGASTTNKDVFIQSWSVPVGENLFADAAAVISPIFGASNPAVTVSPACSNFTDPNDITHPVRVASPLTSPLVKVPTPTSNLPPFDCTVFASDTLFEAAKQSCNDALNTEFTECCNKNGVPVEEYLKTCLCDYNVAGGPDFTAGNVAAFLKECMAHAPECKACPENCNKRGTCKAGVCNCDPGFGGATCNEDVSTPPVIGTLTPSVFNFACEKVTRVIISGKNFFGTKLQCKFPNVTVPATKLTEYQLACDFPSDYSPEAPTLDVQVLRGSIASNVANATIITGCCTKPCVRGTCTDTPSGFFCTCDGTGFKGKRCEIPNVCLATELNGATIPQTPTFGSGSYSCPAGSVLTASSSCKEGVFTPPVISCSPAPNATCPVEALADVIWPKTYAGMNAFGVCKEGYTGEPQRICHANGTWSITVTRPCKPVTCNSLLDGNAHWAATSAFQTATGECKAPFIGKPTRLCTASGVFGEIINPCINPVSCPSESQDVVTFPSTSEGEIAKGICKEGYSGNPTRICNAGGKWGAISNPCVKNTCGSTSVDGILFPAVRSFERSYGVCPPGSGGKPYRDCGPNNTFGPVVGSCLACPEDVYGHATWPATPAGEKAVGICQEGYEGTPERVCNSKGQWPDNLLGFCRQKICKGYNDGAYSFPDIFAGAQKYGECVKGSGRPWRICDLNGNFGPIQSPCKV